MEVENGYGIKPIHQRLGPRRCSAVAGQSRNKVCFHWKAGRCNRYPCPYLHGQSLNDAGASIKKRALVWRNPNPKKLGMDKCCSQNSGKRDSDDLPKLELSTDDDDDDRVKYKVCKDFIASGRCDLGEKCKFLHSWVIGDSFSLLAPLHGHRRVITGITLPTGSDKLYSGSQDNTIRVWDCNTGQCVNTVNLESEVGCMNSEGPWIFAGIKNAVKAWNTQTLADLTLTVPDGESPIGQVYALAFDNGMLFAATENGIILVWELIAAQNSFGSAVSLKGHQRSVVSLVIRAGRLYSGSMDNTIRVWDLTTLRCIETLTGHTSVVMSLLCWDNYLLSCSLDGTVKVWFASKSGKLEDIYTHTEDHGVLKLYGVNDAQDMPVLLCACSDDTVRLYDLPSFSERGRIFSKQEVRAITRGPDGLFFTGDAAGELKVWKWAAKDAAVAPSH